MASWTSPICERCWIDQNSSADGIRRPTRMVDPEVERCAFCGNLTIMGIFVRVNPATVPFPPEED